MNLKWATLKEIFEVKLCNTVLSKDVIISYILRNSDIKKLSFIFHNYLCNYSSNSRKLICTVKTWQVIIVMKLSQGISVVMLEWFNCMCSA